MPLTRAEFEPWKVAYCDFFGINHDGGLAMVESWLPDLVRAGIDLPTLRAATDRLKADPPKSQQAHSAAIRDAIDALAVAQAGERQSQRATRELIESHKAEAPEGERQKVRRMLHRAGDEQFPGMKWSNQLR